jgi:hypothetical protein
MLVASYNDLQLYYLGQWMNIFEFLSSPLDSGCQNTLIHLNPVTRIMLVASYNDLQLYYLISGPTDDHIWFLSS